MTVKKFFVTACAVALAGVTAFSVFADQAKYGDITGEGTVDTKDLTRLMKFIAGEEVSVNNADLTGDGNVGSKDLTRLMRVIAGDYETTVPGESDTGSSTDTDPADTDPADTDPVETDPAPETIPSEPEEDYDLSTTDLTDAFSSENVSGTASDEKASDLLLSAIENNFLSLSKRDMTVQHSFKSTDLAVDSVYTGRAKWIEDPDTFEYDGIKVKERTVTSGKIVESLAYFDGQYTYVNDSFSEYPYYIVGLNAERSAIKYLEKFGDNVVNPDLLENASVTALDDGGYHIKKTLRYEEVSAAVDSYTDYAVNDIYHNLESPTTPSTVSVEYIISESGYIVATRFNFSFNVTLRVDASNTRSKSVTFEYITYNNALGEHVPIERPEGLENYYMYDATEEILADLKTLHDENGNRVEYFDDLYAYICDLYTKEEVEAVIDAYGIVL